jgi:hypothetical protein
MANSLYQKYAAGLIGQSAAFEIDVEKEFKEQHDTLKSQIRQARKKNEIRQMSFREHSGKAVSDNQDLIR